MKPIRPFWERLLCTILATLMALPANFIALVAQSSGGTIVVNEGSPSRSVITNLTFSLTNGVVPVPGGVSVQRLPFGPNIAATNILLNSLDVTNAYRLTFTNLPGNRLPDGNYLASVITVSETNLSASRQSDSGPVFGFFGDQDGDRDVDFFDTFGFRQTWSLGAESPDYDSRFDADGDGLVGISDLAAFNANYFTTLPSAAGIFAHLIKDEGLAPFDGITSDLAIAGTVIRTNSAARLFVEVSPAHSPSPPNEARFTVEATADLQESGAFAFSSNHLAEIYGGPLEFGTGYFVRLQLVETTDVVSARFDLPFRLSAPCLLQSADWTNRIAAVNPQRSGARPGSVAFSNCALVLTEGDSFEVVAERTLTVPPGSSLLRIEFDTPSFDTNSTETIRDAFEVALVDATSRPLTFTVQGASGVVPAGVSEPPGLPASVDACFNLSDGPVPFVAPGAALSGSAGAGWQLSVDISHLAEDSALRLILRMVNNDGDSGSFVRVRSVGFAPSDPTLNLDGSMGSALSLIAGMADFTVPQNGSFPPDCSDLQVRLDSAAAAQGASQVDTPPAVSKHSPDLKVASPRNGIIAPAGARLLLTGQATARPHPKPSLPPVSFEPTNGFAPEDGLRISNQFAIVSGMRFSSDTGGTPYLARLGPPRTAFSSDSGEDTPVNGQNTGEFFLTTERNGTNPPASLLVHFEQPVSLVSGEILDIDTPNSNRFTVFVSDNAIAYYNESLGNRLDGTSELFPISSDPTINNAPEPDLTTVADILGDWLIATPVPLNTHWNLTEIPYSWPVSTETAIIYPIDAGPGGVRSAKANIGVDNGCFIWVNGVYRFGALAGGGVGRYEYAEIDLGDLHPGTNYLQVLREDHGARNGFVIEINGSLVPADGWLIEARDARNSILESLILGPGVPEAGDGLATPWEIQRGSSDITSVKIIYAGNLDNEPDYAFDNFFAESTKANRIELVTVNGRPVEAFDAAGNFFDPLEIRAGQNVFNIVATDVFGQSTSNIIAIHGTTCPQSFANLGTTSASAKSEYGRTSYCEWTKTLYADLTLRNSGTYPIQSPLYVGITHISDPSVTVLEPDGISADGIPYYDFSATLSEASLAPGGTSAARTLAFRNPGRAQFAYTVQILGQLNRAPQFITAPPVAATVGRPLRYDSRATDPDDDALSYAVLVRPAGMSMDPQTGILTWTALPEHQGNQAVTLAVNDGRGGQAEQQFLLTVTATPSNRPPIFISNPQTIARVSPPEDAVPPYGYKAVATDPDGDSIIYSLVGAVPAGLLLEPGTGQMHWAPTSEQIGEHPVSIQADDGRGGSAAQSFTILVLPFNEAPRTDHMELDLAIDQVDTADLAFNAQTLLAAGTVSARVINRGPGALTKPFDVLFFEDRNGNGHFDVLHDLVLGGATVVSQLEPLQNLRVSAPASGQIMFPGSGIWAFVDSRQEIPESNEDNNLSREVTDCIVAPPVGQFDPVIKWNKDTFIELPDSKQVMNTPAVMDLDGDGIPEIIFGSTPSLSSGHVLRGHLRAIRGDTGAEVFTVTDPSYEINAASSVAVGDIDLDGRPEIIVCDSSGYQLIAFEHDGEFKWRSPILEANIEMGAPALADLDQDGIPEIVIGRQAINAANGEILWTGTGGRGSIFGALSLIADVDQDGLPEVIAGNTIYNSSGAILFENSLLPDGLNAIGNFDSDDTAEIVLVSGGRVWLLEHDLSVIWGPEQIQGGSRAGPPTVADFDGDGEAEIGVAGVDRYVVIGADGTTKWQAKIQDSTSGVTGSSVFDFEGDGKAEVVFRDEVDLRIFRGINLEVLYTVPMSSCTWHEYVLVADVDGDRRADIVATANQTCGFGPQCGVYVISDRNNLWVNTRSLWNQHTYHITNVNDDGTIPRYEASSWLTHNTYRLNALPTLAETLAAPDLVACFGRIADDADAFSVSARVGNAGAAPAPAGVLVAIYSGDPRAGGVLVGVSATTKRLQPGEHEDVTLTVTNWISGVLWVVADDDGTGNGSIMECQEGNNYHNTEILLPLVNHAPRFISEPNIEALEGTVYLYRAEARDQDSGDQLFYSLAVAPRGMSIDADNGTIEWSLGSSDAGYHWVAVEATDRQGAKDVQQYLLHVEEALNAAPYFVSLPITQTPINLNYQYDPIARDPDGDPLVFDLVKRPAGMILEASSGSLAWRPSAGQIGAHEIILRASDGRGGVALHSFALEVTPPNTAPVLISRLPPAARIGQLYTLQLEAQDAEGQAIYFGTTNAPLGFDLNPTSGVLTWIPALEQVGTNEIAIIVTDSEGASSLKVFSVAVRPTTMNSAPIFVSKPRLQTRFDLPWYYLARVSDPDADPVTLTLKSGPDEMFLTNQITDFDGNIRNCPSNAQFVVWAPSPAAIGAVNQVELEASDGQGGVVTQRFRIQVGSTLQNSGPVIVSNPLRAATAGQAFDYDLVAVDADGDLLTWLLVAAPAGTSLNVETGTLRWTPTLDQLGSNGFIVEVTDGMWGTDTQEFFVEVSAINRPPSIVSTAPVQTPKEAVYLYAARAIDPDDDPLAWSLIESPAGMSMNLTNGLIRWTIPEDAANSHLVRVRVTDDRGASDTQTYTLYVTDERANNPPVITSLPPRGGGAGREYTYAVSATDPDGDVLTLQLLQGPPGATVIIGSSSPGQVAGTVSWTPNVSMTGPFDFIVGARDAAGASSGQRFTVIVQANEAPRITSIPRTNAVPGVSYRYDVFAFDPNGDTLAYRLTQAPLGMGIDAFGRLQWQPGSTQLGGHSVTIEVADGFGGLARQAFQVTVAEDLEPPVVSLSLISGLVNLDSGMWTGNLGTTVEIRVQATDNVAVVETALRVGSQIYPLNASGVASIPVTNAGFPEVIGAAWDAAGNVGTASSQIQFRDPDAISSISVAFLSPTNQAVISKKTPIIATITNSTPIAGYRVDYAAAADVDFNNISAGREVWKPLSAVTLETPSTTLESVTVATFDPIRLINDMYVVRVYVQPVVGDGWFEPLFINVEGELKFGEFRISFNDLTVPLAGIPITVSRVYDSRLASRHGDFGHGWSLGVQDAMLRIASPDGVVRPGSRVYLNGPDGRRLGFTTDIRLTGGALFVATTRMYFRPDPGVFDRLDADGLDDAYFGRTSLNQAFGGEPMLNAARLLARDGTRYEYSRTAGLQSVTDNTGNRVAYERNGIFHYPAGSTVSDQAIYFIRDARGRIERILGPDGHPLVYTYDAAGDLRAFTDQAANITQYAYDSVRAHFLTNIVDPFGKNALGLVYDESGALKEVRDAAGNPIQQDFDADQNIGTFTDARGVQTFVHFDDRGNETARIIPDISTNYFAYDDNNNLTNAVNANGYATNFVYDVKGNVTRITDALTNVTEIAYNEFGKPTVVTNALGQVLRLQYDQAGHLTEVINNLGFTTRVGRDSQGRVTNLVDAVGNTNSFVYDGGCSCGRPSIVFNPDGSFRRYEYDAFGRTNLVVNELGAMTRFNYAPDGRLLWVEDALTNRTAYLYDGSRLTNILDALGRPTQFRYDEFGRTNQIITAEGGTNEFRYDENGNRTHVIDAVGNVTRFVYDAANRVTNRIDTFGRTNHFVLDGMGNQIEAIDRNGRRRTFAYDALGRMTNEVWWEGSEVVKNITFGFNELGVQTLAADDVARYDYRFDALNRLERVIQAAVGVQAEFSLLYTYTPNGQVESVTDDSGVTVGSKYDNRNRLERRTWNGPGVDPARVEFGYDPSGRRVRTDRYSDLAAPKRIGFTTNAYNVAGVVTNITHLGPAGEELARYDYDFDAAWQIRHWTINREASTFDYDQTGQLTNAANSTPELPDESFRYDANGNRVGAQSSGIYLTNRNNQILSDGTNTYAYDFEGNMASRSNTVTGGLTTYQWDHRNRLMSVLDYNSLGVIAQTVAFEYDAMNRRLAKTVNGQTTRFLYNGDDSWADLDSVNIVTARYLHGAKVDELLARERASDGRGWYLTDHLGTVRDIANVAGTVIAHLDYTAFGQVLRVSNMAAVDRFQFTGRELDAETKLHFFRARYYSALTGRFINEDPVEFKSQDYNLSRYAENNPGVRIDPYGHASAVGYSIGLSATFGAILGATVGAKTYIACIVSIGGEIQTRKLVAATVAGGLVGAITAAFFPMVTVEGAITEQVFQKAGFELLIAGPLKGVISCEIAR